MCSSMRFIRPMPPQLVISVSLKRRSKFMATRTEIASHRFTKTVSPFFNQIRCLRERLPLDIGANGKSGLKTYTHLYHAEMSVICALRKLHFS